MEIFLIEAQASSTSSTLSHHQQQQHHQQQHQHQKIIYFFSFQNCIRTIGHHSQYHISSRFVSYNSGSTAPIYHHHLHLLLTISLSLIPSSYSSASSLLNKLLSSALLIVPCLCNRIMCVSNSRIMCASTT